MISVVTLLICILFGQNPTGRLVINIKGVSSGNINFAIYNNSNYFNNPDFAFRKFSVNKTTIVLEDLPIGDYAFALFLDKNNNGEMDSNFFGIPQEGFAFSNNVMGFFGPPNYEDSKFSIKPNSVTIQNVELIYY